MTSGLYFYMKTGMEIPIIENRITEIFDCHHSLYQISSGQYFVFVAIQSMCKFQLIQSYWCVDGICRLHFIVPDNMVNWPDIDGLVQERHNSSALAMELCLSCTNPSIWHITTQYDDTLSVMSLFATDCNHHLLSTLLNPHYCQGSSVIKLVTVIFCYVSAISYLTIQIFLSWLEPFIWWICCSIFVGNGCVYLCTKHTHCTAKMAINDVSQYIFDVVDGLPESDKCMKTTFFHSLHICQVHSHLLI